MKSQWHATACASSIYSSYSNTNGHIVISVQFGNGVTINSAGDSVRECYERLLCPKNPPYQFVCIHHRPTGDCPSERYRVSCSRGQRQLRSSSN